MKCPKCNAEITLKIGSKVISKGAKVLTGMTTVLTLRCDKCSHIYQTPVISNSFISIKKDEKKSN